MQSFPINRRPRRGATTVEFSIAAGILILLVFGGVEFARISILRQVIDNVAYEACRKVIVPGAQTSEAELHINEVLGRYGVKKTTITITPNPITETTEVVTVKVALPAASNQWGFVRFSEDLVLTSSTSLMTERQPLVQAKAVPEPPPPPPPKKSPEKNPSQKNPPQKNPAPKNPAPKNPSPAPPPSPPPPPPPPPPPAYL